MVSELSLDLFSQANNVIWTKPYLGFDWFGTILGAFLSTESVLLRFTFQSKMCLFCVQSTFTLSGCVIQLGTSPQMHWSISEPDRVAQK